MLMISSSIPHRIREKLFTIDHKKLSLSSRHFLMELHYEMNRYRINKNDIEHVTKMLEEVKQKVKIYLYVFSNSLIDKKYEYESALNYSMSCHDLKLMYDYAFEWNPLSFEILDSYRDFLEKISGDVILSDLLNKKAIFLNNSLIQTNDQKPKIKSKSEKLQKSDKPQNNFDFEFTERLKIQKLLDKVSHFTFKITTLFVLILFFKFLFPYYNYNDFITKKFLPPMEYFNMTHSPSFFKISFLSWFISKYFEQYGQKSTPVKIVNNFGGLNNMIIYLSNLNCYTDKKPIFDYSLEKTIELKTNFYTIFSENSLSLSSKANNFENLARIEHRLHEIFDDMEVLIDRYEMCAKDMRSKSIFSQIKTEFFISLILLIIFSYIVLVSNKKEIMKAIEVFSGIEMSTLEEFRSKLFIQFNQNSFGYPSQEIDNDGALDLEEIEENDNNNLNQNFDLSDLSGKPKFFCLTLTWEIHLHSLPWFGFCFSFDMLLLL
ncbi:hypothetical protein TVAG_465500 [Trichomonas vaginalis G3]|uniref:Uncharacterized protein n=1 Tax=Trichomonas vaginalis (strain ATCC PRA-98 / G3) TaxID=412133 RepID=A2DU15_TRIV3|nr:hypothetical protein TVAGG3_0718270 [Trichomonas vaginalis G3]EAY16162.1 hypothetical protein TVAG_465500 [Trichomonas vaginalis G3]KAI5510404.1 hypothetical protein TVAGG3_0718270 [Trichomonas vaginalis G3]|eukprot:XP_001328385.1 hypothetical protein [Trichomonas vaginalis G3]